MASAEHKFRDLAAFDHGTVEVFILIIFVVVIVVIPAATAAAAVATVSTAFVSVDLPMRMSDAQQRRFQFQPFWHQLRRPEEEDSIQQQDRTVMISPSKEQMIKQHGAAQSPYFKAFTNCTLIIRKGMLLGERPNAKTVLSD